MQQHMLCAGYNRHCLRVVIRSMMGMTVMADEVYSPDNESKFDFGFKLKEIRYPHALVMN